MDYHPPLIKWRHAEMDSAGMIEDKSAWGEGKWRTEPDDLLWPDHDTGLQCAAVRAPGGQWAGYVGVEAVHPRYGSDGEDLLAHGGVITFPSSTGGVPRGLDPEMWWFGFDCGHGILGDYAPAIAYLARIDGWASAPYLNDPSLTYRTVVYVRHQCAQLAAQLGALPPTRSRRCSA